MITRLSLLAVLLALVIATPARADVVRYAPESPSVAIGAGGTTAVAWLRSGPSGQALMLAVRPPGGRFSAPVEIDAWRGDPDLVDFRLVFPRAQVDAAGNVLVTWSRSRLAEHSSTTDQPWMRWRLTDGRLPARLPIPSYTSSGIVLSPSGQAWVAASPGNSAGVASATPGNGFGPAHAIPQMKSPPSLAATDDGVIAFGGDGGFSTLKLARIGPDGDVRSVVDLGAVRSAFWGVSASLGGAVAGYYSAGAELHLFTVPPNGSTVTDQVVPGTEFGARNVRAVGIGDSGEVTIMWLRVSNAAGKEVIVRDPDGTFGPITVLGPAVRGGGATLSGMIGRDGAALLAGIEDDGRLSVVTRRPGGPFVVGPRVSPEGRRVITAPAAALGAGTSLLAWVDGALPGIPERSRRLVVVSGAADGTARSDVLDTAVRDPNPPTGAFFVIQYPRPTIDRRGRLLLTLSCSNSGYFVCDATLRIRRARRSAVLARRTVRREPDSLTRVRIALPRSVVREVRSGRRKTLWVTQRATRGGRWSDVPVTVR